MDNQPLQLKEESIPSIDELDRDIHEIPTIEVTPEENVAEPNQEDEAGQEAKDADLGNDEEDKSELISSKKNKKFNKFGKALKSKIKNQKSKGKSKKKTVTNDSESVADDLVIESSKVMSEEEVSDVDGNEAVQHEEPDIQDAQTPPADNTEIAEEQIKKGDAPKDSKVAGELEEKITDGKQDKTKWKNKLNLLGNRFKGKGKSKAKQNAADENGLLDENDEPVHDKEEVKKIPEDVDEDNTPENNSEEKNDTYTGDGIGDQVQETPEDVPTTEAGSGKEEGDPPCTSPTPSKSGSNTRETRRQARRQLLEKMEAEGKIKSDAEIITSNVNPATPEEVAAPGKPKNKRKKKDAPDRALPVSDAAAESPAIEEDGAADTGNLLATPRRTKKRRKKKKSGEEEDGGIMSDKTDDNVVISNAAVVQESDLSQRDTRPQQAKTSTLKRFLPNKKTKGGPTLPPEKGPEVSAAPTVLSSPALRKLESAMSVKVHYAEPLYPTLYLLHPLVRVHLLDSRTGKPLPSTLGDARFQTIQPLLTDPFDLRLNKTMSPCWEEQLLVPETYSSIIANERAVVVFEIVDIVPAKALKKHRTGWNHIAWGFLKLKSGQGGFNVERKLRLQLYKYPVVEQSIQDILVGGVRNKYPSTLYVTVHHVTDKTILASLYVDQVSAQNPALSQYIDSVISDPGLKQDEIKETRHSWSRAPGQMCKIPKTLMCEILTPELGCLLMAFSTDGRRLACGCVSKTGYPILVYSIPEAVHLFTLQGHHNILYDLKWYKTALLSASSDCTARIWRNGVQDKLMSHPTFVYTAKWIDKRKIITGSYDRIIRIWDSNCAGQNCALLTQLHGHGGHVNSIVLKGNDTFYSGDSKGQIIEWNGGGAAWTQAETIHPPEMKDVPISVLVLHPNKRRMFVQTRDSHVRLVDLRIRAITQRYTGHTNTREHLRCTVSPCGTYVLSSSEDGSVYVWIVETGDLTYNYKTDIPHSTSDVKFHPHDNYVAVSGFGSAQPVALYKREDKVATDVTEGLVGSTMGTIKEKLLTVSPSKPDTDIFTTTNRLKMGPGSSGLPQSTPLVRAGTLNPLVQTGGTLNPGLSFTLTPGAAQISGLPQSNTLKLVILHDYTAERSDEISLKSGEHVKLIYIDTDGWWVGENLSGQQGYFPANHVEQPTPAQSMSFRSFNHTAGTPKSKRKIDFNMSLTNGGKEWQTFESTLSPPVCRSPRSPRSDNDSVASSTMSASRRRHTTAKVGAK